jgi:predicted thioesterase
MKQLEKGIKGSAELTVTKNELASAVGSGCLDVLATPVMIMLMEKAACECIAPYFEGDETTVGTELDVKHVSATPEGMKVKAVAELVSLDGRELVFSVMAEDESGLIGKGLHKRFLVYGERFMEKANAKKQ